MSIRSTAGPRGDDMHEIDQDTCTKCGVLEPDLRAVCPGRLFGRRRRFVQEIPFPAPKQALHGPLHQ